MNTSEVNEKKDCDVLRLWGQVQIDFKRITDPFAYKHGDPECFSIFRWNKPEEYKRKIPYKTVHSYGCGWGRVPCRICWKCADCWFVPEKLKEYIITDGVGMSMRRSMDPNISQKIDIFYVKVMAELIEKKIKYNTYYMKMFCRYRKNCYRYINLHENEFEHSELRDLGADYMISKSDDCKSYKFTEFSCGSLQHLNGEVDRCWKCEKYWKTVEHYRVWKKVNKLRVDTSTNFDVNVLDMINEMTGAVDDRNCLKLK
jgi:hypothetical protein